MYDDRAKDPISERHSRRDKEKSDRLYARLSRSPPPLSDEHRSRRSELGKEQQSFWDQMKQESAKLIREELSQFSHFEVQVKVTSRHRGRNVPSLYGYVEEPVEKTNKGAQNQKKGNSFKQSSPSRNFLVLEIADGCIVHEVVVLERQERILFHSSTVILDNASIFETQVTRQLVTAIQKGQVKDIMNDSLTERCEYFQQVRWNGNQRTFSISNSEQISAEEYRDLVGRR